MPISFDCACGRKIRTADENAGRSASCPACGVTVLVPGSDAGRPWRDAPTDQNAAAGNGFGYNLQSEEVVPTARPSAPPVPYDRPGSDDPRRPARPPLDDRFVKRPPTRSGRTDRGALAGVLMMVGAVVWFVVGQAVGITFFYPPILFIIGLICFIKGLANRN